MKKNKEINIDDKEEIIENEIDNWEFPTTEINNPKSLNQENDNIEKKPNFNVNNMQVVEKPLKNKREQTEFEAKMLVNYIGLVDYI